MGVWARRGEQGLAALLAGEAGVEGLGEGPGLQVHGIHLEARAEGDGHLARGLGAGASAGGGAGGVVAPTGRLGGRLGVDALDGSVGEEGAEVGAFVGVGGGEDEAGQVTHARIVRGRRGSRNGAALVDRLHPTRRLW